MPVQDVVRSGGDPVTVVLVLAASRLLFELVALYAFTHFGVHSVGDWPAILHTNLLFGWGAAQQSWVQLVAEISGLVTLLLLYPAFQRCVGERRALCTSCLGRAFGAAMHDAAGQPGLLHHHDPMAGEVCVYLAGTNLLVGVYLSDRCRIQIKKEKKKKSSWHLRRSYLCAVGTHFVVVVVVVVVIVVVVVVVCLNKITY